MSEFSRAMRNKEGKAFRKYKDKLECVSNGDITDTLSELCIDRFKENRKELKKFRSILNFKLFFKYDVPLIALLIGTGMALDTPRETSQVPYYNLEQTMISDDKIVQDIDDNNYIVLPSGTEVGSDYIEVDNVDKIIQYQVKSGTRSAIVTVGLDEEGEMEVVDSLVGNFFDRNTDVFADVEEMTIDEKYQELIEDIGDFVLESQSLTSTTKKEIKKLLESEKTTIITTVAEYVQAGELELEETTGSWYGSIALREFLTILVTAMIAAVCQMLGAGEMKTLSYDEDRVKYGDSYAKINVSPFAAYASAKRAFVRADDCRRMEIKRLVRENLSETSQKYFK